jgi:hypothetical protein
MFRGSPVYGYVAEQLDPSNATGNGNFAPESRRVNASKDPFGKTGNHWRVIWSLLLVARNPELHRIPFSFTDLYLQRLSTAN